VVLRDQSRAIGGGTLSSLRRRYEVQEGRVGYPCRTRSPPGLKATMKTEINVRPSESLRHVRYEIRGKLARRAHEMQRMG